MKPAFKPYQLAWVTIRTNNVEGGERRYVGEVMSYPVPPVLERNASPEATIMVRRVPGHPATLEELPLSTLAPLDAKMSFVHYARVRGAGEFPEDMLRYDSAVNVNFALVPRPTWQGGCTTRVLPEFGLEGLWIARVTKTQYAGWAIARWNSYLWRLEEKQTEQLKEGL